MLLNLSNHPYAHWPENQKTAAQKQFGSVTDLPHPEIDPAADPDKILQLAEEYEIKIRKTDPTAVHLMGEHSFCHALIFKLQKAGYPVYCSTTKRSVEQISNSEVRRKFEFVRFRLYNTNY